MLIIHTFIEGIRNLKSCLANAYYIYNKIPDFKLVLS